MLYFCNSQEKSRKSLVPDLDNCNNNSLAELKICRLSRGLRCKMKGTDVTNSPAFGYCATQKTYYFEIGRASCRERVLRLV